MPELCPPLWGLMLTPGSVGNIRFVLLYAQKREQTEHSASEMRDLLQGPDALRHAVWGEKG